VLLPAALNEQSVYIDCNDEFAQAMDCPRETLICGTKVSQTFVPANYQRCVDIVSVLATHPMLVVHDVPCYPQKITYDVIVSLEHDDRASKPTKPDEYTYAQMIFVHPRPLHVVSSPVASTSPLLAGTEAMSIDECTSASPTASTSSTLQCSVEPSGTAALTVSSNDASVLDHTMPQVWPQSECLERPHAVVIEPVTTRTDRNDVEAGSSEFMWVSLWENDRGGSGRPSPFVSVDAATVRTLFPSCDYPQLEAHSDNMSMMDALATPSTSSDIPTVRFHPVGST